MRIQNILALTDFSIQAEHGLDRAAALAAAHGARLRILYACETPPLQLSDPMARLDQRARQLARRHGVEVSTIAGTGRLLEDGLTEAARADLMVAHGRMYRDGVVLPRRQLLYPLLRRSPCPVLVVQRPWQGAYARVLVSVDFCAASRPLVRHQAGERHAEAVRRHYERLGVTGEVAAFIDDMAEALGWADLVVCRAGAMTVAEVAAVGVAALFIPLPHAIDDHQTANARYLSECGGGWMMPNPKSSPPAHTTCWRQPMSLTKQASWRC